MEINRLELKVLLFILSVQRHSCPFFPKSLWRKRKGRKTPHFSGLARFKYQPLLAFHWCSAVFARLFWELLQHMNLQSADTYATELKVFFRLWGTSQSIVRFPALIQASASVTPYISSVFHSGDEASLLPDTKLILQMNLLYVYVKHFTTFIITVSKSYCIKAWHCIQTRFECKYKVMLLLLYSHFSVTKTVLNEAFPNHTQGIVSLGSRR